VIKFANRGWGYGSTLNRFGKDFKMEANPGFSEFARSGFQIRFENGWTVSVQFSATHYCNNRNMNDPHTLDRTFRSQLMEFAQELSCPDAEIAAFKGDEWHKFDDGDTVKGWTTPAEFLALCVEIAAK
jgi:hypothetical protein